MRAPPAPTERQVQRAILAMAGTCFRDVFITAIPNGAHLAGNDVARFKQMGALKGDGLKVGIPDLLILWSPGKGAFLEVKRAKTGRMTPEQQIIHERLRGLGWPVATVTSIDEAYHFLRHYCEAPCSAQLSSVTINAGVEG
ncbi:MAG: hypothetical protein JWR80_9462 [Bradyrhizobium sp.]|nr:hypothetical protein [Bradyrhizobium sp.]